MTRKIIHCDCDCFYAAIEMRDDPALRGRPVAVGGRPESRGVVATCNYEARRSGIHSAMAMAQAVKRCPDLVVIPPAMEKYRDASRQILAIYRDYTPLVEPLSLDEAYLDVSGSDRCRGSATLMADEIRARIRDAVGITASAGVAPNKFLAKIASDWRKPDGLFVLRPEGVDAFVQDLPVGKLFGVGKATEARLNRLGVHTCGDLQSWDIAALGRHFGKFGQRLHDLCRGRDERPVCPTRERKSVSVEETYAQDLPDLAACLRALAELLPRLVERIERARCRAQIERLNVKLRFSDFTATSVESVARATDFAHYERLLTLGYRRRQLPVRLLGVGIGLAARDELQQGRLFTD